VSIRILLVDDHAPFRASLGALLARQPGLQVVGEAADGAQAVAAIRLGAADAQPDLVLMDLEMPVLGGLEATRQLLALRPDLRVLGLSSHDDPPFAAALLAAGAQGYLLKDDPLPELLQAIHAVAAGGRHVSASVAAALGFCGGQSPHSAD
jgi:DNA-binding NarL/FixJ family response regulator